MLTALAILRRCMVCGVIVLTSALAGLPVQRERYVDNIPPVAPAGSAFDGDPVNLATGLYVRTTVDLALFDVIPVVFARTYRNRDSRSRPFGIGTNHSFGSFLVGDAPTLSYVDLILPDGGRIHYQRTSRGTGHIGAEFEHTTTPSEYLNSRLFWNGAGWTVLLADGAIYTFPDCPPAWARSLGSARAGRCTVSSYRDRDGNQLQMRHDQRTNLLRIQTPNGAAIDLTYDGEDRIVMARSSYGQQVTYHYDVQGRLVRVTSSDGQTSSYVYDQRHQMIEIEEPGVSIINTFDDGGRCVLNDVRTHTTDQLGRPHTQRSLFTFAYTLHAGSIIATEVERPSGRRLVTFNDRGYVLTDTDLGRDGSGTSTIFERDVVSNAMRRLTVGCGPEGRRVQVEAPIEPDTSTRAIRRHLQRACASAAGGR